MRKVKNWLLTLDVEVQKNFYIALRNEFNESIAKEILEKEYPNIINVIGDIIVWYKSPQGREYWENLYHELEKDSSSSMLQKRINALIRKDPTRKEFFRKMDL